MAVFERSITVDAPPDRVWALMTNPASWGQWFPELDAVSGLESVREGAVFTWRDGEKTGGGTVAEVNPDRGLLTVVITEDGRQTTHSFDLDRTGGLFGIGGNDTRVKYRRSYDAPGGFLGEFIAGGNPADALDVKRTLEKIERLAEG